MDFGEHIPFQSANSYCRDIVGKENGVIVGRGSYLASVDKINVTRYTQAEQIALMKE